MDTEAFSLIAALLAGVAVLISLFAQFLLLMRLKKYHPVAYSELDHPAPDAVFTDNTLSRKSILRYAYVYGLKFRHLDRPSSCALGWVAAGGFYAMIALLVLSWCLWKLTRW